MTNVLTIGAGGSCFHVVCAPSFVTKSCGVFLLNVAVQSTFPLTCSASWIKRWLNIWHHQISHFFLLLEYPLVWECANWPVGHQQNERMTDHRIHWNTFSQGYFVIKFPHTSIPKTCECRPTHSQHLTRSRKAGNHLTGLNGTTVVPTIPLARIASPKKNSCTEDHPGRLTWNIQITHLERKMIFSTSMIMFHVNLPGCTLQSTNMATEHETFHIYIY